MLIKTNTKRDKVKRQKAIIDYVHKHKDRHGTDSSMKEAMNDYGKLTDKETSVKHKR